MGKHAIMSLPRLRVLRRGTAPDSSRHLFLGGAAQGWAVPLRTVNLRMKQEAAGDTSAELRGSLQYQWCVELWSQGERKDKGNEGERKGEGTTAREREEKRGREGGRREGGGVKWGETWVEGE